ncbi:A/G-specific adenine glycosylase [Novosphingobium sp.]|uniref:A/G-specific adenine glycosylase n=1 Tax=Novosphingobium sp. TaxID=1874826 RepID=UPI0035AFFBFC
MEATAKHLLDWYDANARVLPWRAPPGAPPPDPYRVWLSEVMLQQTTVAAVGPYFAKFLALWPTVQDLAAAEDAEVMSAWAGLGYYARARNLLACARAVAARGGVFPDTEEGLRELPGVGAYTAAAVAAIAFARRAAVVDANVERVVSRLYAIATPLPQAKAEIRARTEQLTPNDRPGDFAQAMMDLGATVCTVRAPRCLLCPLSADCAGRRLGPEQFPVKAPKRAKPQRRGQAFWIERDGAVWLVRRTDKGMLGGMRALPDNGWSARSDGEGAPPLAGPWQDLGTVRHSFTHFDLDLQLMLYSGADWARLEQQPGEWWPAAQLDRAGLPTLFAKAARLAPETDGEN